MPNAPNIFPALRYHDARAAIAWLESALGLEVVSVGESNGRVGHAELAFGPGMVMLGSVGTGDERFDRAAGCSSVYMVADDVGAVFERATAAGATVLRPLADTDYGSREFTVADPEGNAWSVGDYVPAR